jgi:hypothetical protein
MVCCVEYTYIVVTNNIAVSPYHSDMYVESYVSVSEYMLHNIFGLFDF